MHEPTNRRDFLAVTAALLASSHAARAQPQPAGPKSGAPQAEGAKHGAQPPSEHAKGATEEVGAVEDLMREHGVIRRVLVVYRESAMRLRTQAAGVPADALHKAAALMRDFGEAYHERQLEEVNIFPMLLKHNTLSSIVRTLIEQHQRGREITAYVLSNTRSAIARQSALPLALALDGFARMYEEHAAFEDTLVFPAWKKLLSPEQLHEMGEHFEAIEHKTFGKDGFEHAVGQIAQIEHSLGIELAALTAPPVTP